MSGPKRHHYVPKFLLHEFSLAPDAKNPVIWKLDKKTGRPTRTAIEGETVVSHFYRLQEKTGDPSSVERGLSMIEGIAADHIERLLKGSVLSPAERAEAATFFLLHQRRTPRSRHWAVEVMKHALKLQVGIDIGNAEDKIRAYLQKEHGSVTDEEVAAFQDDLLAASRGDRIVAEATSDHKVLGIFIAGNEVAEAIASQMTWCILRTDPPHEFVIADHPLCIFDAIAPPGHGAGWLSSPAVEEILPIGRHMCLTFKPGPPDVMEKRADGATLRT